MTTGIFYNKNLLISLSIIVIFVTGCSRKETVPVVPLPFSEERYSIEFTGAWTSPDFSLAVNAHFTNLIGMVHSKDTFMWKLNAFASLGLERLAEDGSNGTMLGEMNAMLVLNKAKSTFNFYPTPLTATRKDTVIVTTDHSCISFASMVAPSPDWFIGVSSFNCINNNQWIEESIIPLYTNDAGTEEGDTFSYNNLATQPQQLITVLKAANATVLANGNSTLKPIATVKFRRIK